MSEVPGSTGGNPWIGRLPALIFSHVVGTTNVVSVMAMAPVISQDLNLSAAEFGAFVSAYYAAQAAGSMPAGAITDRFGVGRTLVFAHILMFAAAAMLAVAVGYYQCLGAMFLMGFAYCMTNPSTARGVLDWFPKERRGTAMGLKQVGVPIGGVIAAGNGALAAHVHWQSIMWGVAAMMVVNGIYCLVLVRYHVPLPKDQRRSIVANLGDVLKDWNFSIYAVLNGLLNVGQTNFFGFLTLFLTSVVKASQETAGFAIGLAQTSSAFARIGWGVVSDRYFVGKRGQLVAWICGAAAVFLVLMAFVGPGPGLYAGLGLAMALGITIASFAPVVQAIAVEAVEPRLAGSAMGVNMVGVHLGGMLGPIVFGWVVDNWGGYDAAWIVTAGIVVVGLILLLFVFKEGARGDG
ncbi:MAG: MFS transporter [Rhodospirillales bacterium]|nr:MFS transporter [Rhodospirillales bacterium]